jgi:hypothetical protein
MWKRVLTVFGSIPVSTTESGVVVMRIYKARYYLMELMTSSTGHFPKAKPVIVTGHKAQNHKAYVVGEYFPTGQGVFRLADGHIPEFQPTATEKDALQWLDDNYFSHIAPVPQV